MHGVIGVLSVLLFASSVARAEVAVAIIDDAIDYAHPLIASHITENIAPFYKTNQAYLSVMRNNPPPQRADSHGNAVASIVVGNLSGTRLLNVALPPYRLRSRELNMKEIRKFNADAYRKELRTHFEWVSGWLELNNVRVLNYSRATYTPDIFSELFRKASGWQQFWYQPKLLAYSQQVTRIISEEFRRFVTANPKVIFVVAAGNQTIALETAVDHTSKFTAPNMIVVTALDGAKRLASFANWSNQFVQIGAPGTAVPALNLNGRYHLFNGTSAAAPMVARELARIFLRDETLTAQAAIDELLEHHTETRPELAHQIAGGRILKLDEDDLRVLWAGYTEQCEMALRNTVPALPPGR